mmetsp:Transcript_11131/g.22555  ORF Transcript_11131/g.22555 Transcript_11131/m.22555 type:complete len:252 (-) Transcript_11131:102-857(-)
MIATLAVPFHLIGLAIGEAVVRRKDTHARAALVKLGRPERAAQLHLYLRAVAGGHRLEDMYRPLQPVDEGEYFRPAAPHALVAHLRAILLRLHAVLLGGGRHQLVGADRLVGFDVQQALGVLDERIDRLLPQLLDSLAERRVVHVKVSTFVLERHADRDRVEEAVARPLHLLDTEGGALLAPIPVAIDLRDRLIHARVEAAARAVDPCIAFRCGLSIVLRLDLATADLLHQQPQVAAVLGERARELRAAQP